MKRQGRTHQRVCRGIGLAFLILLPGLGALAAVATIRLPTGEADRNLVSEFISYASAQPIYRRTDWDGDGFLEYAHPYSLLGTQKDAAGYSLKLITEAAVQACGPDGMPLHGFLFRDCVTIGGKPIDPRKNFALSATWGEKRWGRPKYTTYMIKTDGVVWAGDLGRLQFVDDFPADPEAAGWTRVYDGYWLQRERALVDLKTIGLVVGVVILSAGIVARIYHRTAAGTRPGAHNSPLALFDRAGAGNSAHRFAYLGTYLLMMTAYAILVIFLFRKRGGHITGPDRAVAWSLVPMMIAPLWAMLLAVILCGTAVAAERERGTLDALRLLPVRPPGGMFLDRFRRRGALPFLALASAVGFYVMPKPREVGLLPLPLLARPAAALFGAENAFAWGWVEGYEPSWRGLISGIKGAFLLDAGRVYAVAALSMAVSLRFKRTADALVAAAMAGLFWIAASAAAEYAASRVSGACLQIAYVLEFSLWYVVIPTWILWFALRRFERWAET